jgi:NADH-quinone oxidoreductase subunit J
MFFVIALAVIFAGVMLLNLRNVVYMTLALGGVFLGVAGIYILLNAEFLAFAQVLIYAGAITILILFAIMLTRHDAPETEHENRPGLHVWIARVTVLFLGLFIWWTIHTAGWYNETPPLPWPVNGNVMALGEALFHGYVIPFELVSVVLIVALIGAVVLGRKEESE